MVFFETADTPERGVVGLLGTRGVKLFHEDHFEDSDSSDPWTGDWRQSDPEIDGEYVRDGCGPIAGRNLLNWYGEDYDWELLFHEMHTNGSMSLDKAMELCLPLVWELFSYSTCVAVLDNLNTRGTAQMYFDKTLEALTPTGYTLHKQSGAPLLSRILAPLAAGHPVVVLYNVYTHMNHYVVITGVEWDDEEGDYWLTMANKSGGGMYWKNFVDRWSLDGFGNDTERGFMNYAGESAYPLWYYARSDDASWDFVFPGIDGRCVETYRDLFPGYVPKVSFYEDSEMMPINLCFFKGKVDDWQE